MTTFRAVFPACKPIIAVVHLPPLPGFAGSPGMAELVRRAVSDAARLESGGVDGVLVENEYDRPHEVEASAATVAAMTRIVSEVAAATPGLPVGVEILLNDPRASLAVAHASGARFIRTDYFVDRMSRPEYGGEMAIDPAGLMRFRAARGADRVLVLADVQVKYAAMLEPRPLEASAYEARRHAADAIVVTGRATGAAPTRADLDGARRGAAGTPVLIGSGLDARNAHDLLASADGAIVGTALQGTSGIDAAAVARLMAAVTTARTGE